MQPHLINYLQEISENEVNSLSDYGTPWTPYFIIVKPSDEMDRIERIHQSKYRSSVRMLLFLIEYSRRKCG
jgi:hypothetical protein